MSNRKDINLSQYNISSNRYRELKYMCLQYPEWKEKIKQLNADIKAPIITGLPNGSRTSDKICEAVTRKIELEEKCRIIEQTAIEADSCIYEYLLKNVTKGIPYNYLDVPSSYRQFYRVKRKFFYLLSQRV